MRFSIVAENIKCGGCANRIQSQLNALEGVALTEVNYETGQVSWESEEALVAEVRQQLQAMGYPEVGRLDGVQAMGAKAKSYVSCAIGKLSD